MKCEICHKNDAEVAVTRLQDGVKRELYVCKECAKNLGERHKKSDEIPADVKKVLDELPRSVQTFMLEINNMAREILHSAIGFEFEHPCPKCGMSIGTYKHVGYLGCPNCYKEFANFLEPHIRGEHPSFLHIGRTPQTEISPFALSERLDFIANDLVVGSSVMLFRNFADEIFPKHLRGRDKENCAVLLQKSRETVDAFMAACPWKAEIFDGRSIYGSYFEQSVSANFEVDLFEENSLKIISSTDSFDLDFPLYVARRLDYAFAQRFNFAFSPKLGYLTPDISMLGNALNAMCELNLVGLFITERLEQSLRAVADLGYQIPEDISLKESPFVIEISTTGTLGQTEEMVVGRFKKVIVALAEAEISARSWLLENRPYLLDDFFARSLSLLQTARVLEPIEAKQNLYVIWVAHTMGLIKGISDEKLHDNSLLNMECNNAADEYLADIERASLYRKSFKKVKLSTLYGRN